MITLTTIVIFFFVLIILYPVTAAVLVLIGWFRKRRVVGKDHEGAATAQIDDRTDRLKNRWFVISLVLAFFVIAPFIVLVIIMMG